MELPVSMYILKCDGVKRRGGGVLKVRTVVYLR